MLWQIVTTPQLTGSEKFFGFQPRKKETMAKYSELNLGQIEALVNKLGGMKVVKDILSDAVDVKVQVLDHVVDGNADPFVPDGWTVIEHKKQGDMKITRDGDNILVNGKQLDLYLSEGQKNGKVTEGNKLRTELADKPVLNANLLDYLYEHQELIPESWKDKVVFFWATIYRDSDGDLCVRCLYWFGGEWYWSSGWLDGGFDGDYPAVVSQVSA